MYKYIIRRVLLMIPVLLGVTFAVFCIMELTPGDPAVIILQDAATEESVAALHEELGLDDPLLVRYFNYMKDIILHGDFGASYKNQQPVYDQIAEKLPNTIILAATGMLIAVLIGIPCGIMAAKHQNTFVDGFSTVLALIGQSAPAFWMGLMLVILFSLNLRWLPSSGMNTDSIGGLLKTLILPAMTIGIGSAASTARMTRSSMLEVIRQDYISTARSKGITEGEITRKHMLGNAMIPIITSVGLQFGALLGGSVMTESIFSWPGLGRFVVESIKTKDTPCVLGSVIVLATMFSIVNLLVDLLYAFVDPRIKSQYKAASKPRATKVEG